MKTSHAYHEIECEEATIVTVPSMSKEIMRFPAETIQAVMDPRIYKIALACWVCFLAVFWVTFWISANALFMVVIGTVYAIVFFGVPYLMSRQVLNRPAPARSLLAFMHAPFATLDETMRGWEALRQVVLVPLCLTGGGIAISFIIHAARVVH